MRLQIQDDQNDQEVYIAIEEKEILQEGSIKLYKNVLNECVRNGTVDPLVKDYILEEYKCFKFMFRTRNEILNFAESLQQKFNQWQESPEREIALKSLILCRARRNRAIWMIASALYLALGSYVTKNDDLPGLGTPPNWLGKTLISTGILNAGLWFFGGFFGACDSQSAKSTMLACIKNRLSYNLNKEYVYSIFSSKSLIRDDKEFIGFLESEAGKIENIGQIVTSYL